MAVNQDFTGGEDLEEIVKNTISSVIAIPDAFNLDYKTLKRSKINGEPKFNTLVASEIQGFFQEYKAYLIASTQQNKTSLNLLQQFRDFFGRVLYSKFYVSVTILFDDLKTLGFILNQYISSLKLYFQDNDETQSKVKLTEAKYGQISSQVKEIGQVLFAEVKNYRENMDLESLFEILQQAESEMQSVNESITINKFIPGLNNELTHQALAFGINKKFIKKELESLSLSYLKYINSGLLFQEEKRSYYKDFKERLHPSHIQEYYSLDEQCNKVLLQDFPKLHALWMSYFRKESCVSYRRLRKALYLHMYSKFGQKISKSALRLEQYLAPIAFFTLNNPEETWKFESVELFMNEFTEDLEQGQQEQEEVKEENMENSPLYPDSEVKFELRFIFEKNGALSSKKLMEYSYVVTMNDHVYFGNSNPWYQNDVELLTRTDFHDPNGTQLILLKGEPKGYPQVVDLSGIQAPIAQSEDNEEEEEELKQNQLRLNSMNFFSYHKAEEPVYRIREGAIILIDSLKQRAYKVIENLPIELKSFYLWEKVRDFQIIDPWMEFLSPKENFTDIQNEFTIKDLLGGLKIMGQIAIEEKQKPIPLNQKFNFEKSTDKQVMEFQRVVTSVVLRAKEELPKRGLNVGVLMKKVEEFKQKVPSVPLKITQPNVTIQFQKTGLSIKFIKI